ncbi:MAG TPA: MFS transporter [Steroidobacteraceae bacterium]
MKSTERTNFRWLVMLLIISLVIINYIDRSAIGYAIGPISKSLGIKPAQWGLVSAAFSVGYFLVAFISGPMVDHYGTKKVLGVSIVVWSLASMLTAVASTFLTIFVARVILGIGEGPGFPAASRATSRWMPKNEQGFVLSLIGGVGVAGSILISGPIVTQLIPHVGWRVTFIILGALGLLWTLAWVIIFSDDPALHKQLNPAELAYISDGKTDEERSPVKSKIELRKVLANKSLLAIAFGFFSWGYIFWGLLYWLPGYLSATYGLDIKSVGLFSSLPWAAGVVGALAGGLMLKKLYLVTQRLYLRCVVMAFFVLLAGMCMIPVFLIHSLTVAVTFISLGVGFGFVTAGFWWVASIETSPDQPGLAAGLVDASFAASGIATPIIMGYTVEYTGSFDGGFLTMMVIAVAGSLAMVVFTRGAGAEKCSALEVARVSRTRG